MKFGKLAKYYAVATQGILSIIILTVGGLFIGLAIGKDTIWPAIFAIIGMFFGLSTFIIYLLKLQKEEDKKEVDKQDENED